MLPPGAESGRAWQVHRADGQEHRVEAGELQALL
jgi:hypothetical protein